MIAASTTWAGPSCFTTKAEYEKVKAQLPPSLRTLPAVFTVDAFITKAGMIIDAPKDNPNKLKLQMKVVSPITTDRDNYIKSACIVGKELKVVLDDKSQHTVGLVGNNLFVMNNTLVKSDIKSFNKLLSPTAGGGAMFGAIDDQAAAK